MLRSENGRPATWIYVDGRDRPLIAIVHDLQAAVAAKVKLPPGISVASVVIRKDADPQAVMAMLAREIQRQVPGAALAICGGPCSSPSPPCAPHDAG